MKKRNILIYILFLLGILIFGFILLDNGDSIFKRNNKFVVHTPARVGKGESKASFELPFVDLKSAVSNSDIVADITITSWLSEEEDFSITFFNADINSCLKGNSPNKIILSQYGNGKSTLTNYPLFDVGDRMIVFLNKSNSSDYEDAYYLMGEHRSIIDVKMINNTLYAADVRGRLTNGLLSDENYNFTIVDSNIRGEFLSQIYLYSEKLKSNSEPLYQNFFLYEELVNAIKKVAIESKN